MEGPVGEGMLNLPRDFEFTRALTSKPLKFTCTGPHMLAKVLTDRHYGDRAELSMAIAAVLRRQVAGFRAEVVQIDEANISGHPEDREWALEAINHVLEGAAGSAPYTSASATTAGRAFRRASGATCCRSSTG